MEDGEGLANFALDWVFTVQSDHTEILNQEVCVQSALRECVQGYLNLFHLDASQDMELVPNSNHHSTHSQVHAISIPETHDWVQSLLDPLCL